MMRIDSRKLLNAMQLRGVNSTELAKLARLDKATVSKAINFGYKNGAFRTSNARTVFSLAAALKVDTRDILEDSNAYC